MTGNKDTHKQINAVRGLNKLLIVLSFSKLDNSVLPVNLFIIAS